MKKYLLPHGKTYYKACLHTHTNLSDGIFSPEEVKKMYLEHGYSVVAYTDHDFFTPHNDLTDKDFVALNAQEAQIDENPNRGFRWDKTYHINFYAKRDDIKTCPAFPNNRRWISKHKELLNVTEEAEKNSVFCYYSQQSVNNLIAECNRQGFFACYNHPDWSLQNYADYCDLKGLWGIEVFNTGSIVDKCRESTIPFDDLLKRGNDLFPLCTDDMHSPLDTFGGWVMVAADSLTYDNIVDALLKGDFYASTGPEIKEFYYDTEKKIFHIETSPVASIRIVTDWRYRKLITPPEGAKTVTSADITCNIPLGRWEDAADPGYRDSYFRYELTDANGNVAYTRAFRMKEVFGE